MRKALKILIFLTFLHMAGQLSAQQSYNITFLHDGMTVYGTFSVPAGSGRFPTIIINPGTGAVDRDGTLPMLGANVACLYPGLLNDTLYFYKELAEALTDSGYAVLRYDKLEYSYPSTLGNITFHKLWLPVESAINYVKTRNDVDTTRIILLGHSEGSALIPFIAKGRKDISALISVAGARTPLDSLMAYQLLNIAKTCNGDTMQAIGQGMSIMYYFNLVRTHSWNTSTPNLFGVSPAVWYDYVRATDSVAKNYNADSIPTLFMGMGLDINVPPAELIRLQQEVSITNDFWTMPGLIHYLCPVNNPHVPRMLPDTIVYWLRRHVPVAGIPRHEANDLQVTVSPNPFRNHFRVQVDLKNPLNLKVTIRNMYGQVVLQKDLSSQAGKNTIDLDLSNQAPGLYILSLQTAGSLYSQRIIKAE